MMRLPVSFVGLGADTGMASCRGRDRLSGANLVLAESPEEVAPLAPGAAVVDASALSAAAVAQRLIDAQAQGQSAVRAIAGSLGESVRALDEIRELLARNVPIEVVANAVPAAIRWSWREHLPLAGRRIAVTRARESGEELSELLIRLGAEVISAPTLEYQGPEDPGPLDRAIEGLHRYEVIVLTSAHAVQRFVGRLLERGKDGRWCAGLKIAAVGPGTRRALRERGLQADLMPDIHRSEELAPLVLAQLRPGGRVLLPRAQEGRDALQLLLTAGGALVDVVPSYRTVLPGASSVAALRSRLEAGTVDAVTFASGSAVRNLVSLLGGATLLAEAPVVCLGPVTAEACVAAGVPVRAAAESASFTDLAETLIRTLRS